jgi:ADP-heptose:LPS heptosyltransferase
VKASALKILLIRLRLIGDVVLTTPAIRALRQARPDSWITYLVEPGASPVVLPSPHLDEVIVAPLSHGLERWKHDLGLARRLRRDRFDVVVDFHGGPRSSWLALATGAPTRIGYTVKGRSWMYTQRVFRPRGHHLRHSVENQWDLLEALLPGIGRPTREHDFVEMGDDAAAASQVDQRLAEAGVVAGHQLIVVHVGAGNEYRRWPESAFIETVASLVAADPNRRIILTTGAAQAATCRMILEGVQARSGAAGAQVAAWWDLGLSELRNLVGRASVFLGGDSGPAHVAATTGTPMVVIYGPTLPEVWGPWRDPSLVTELVDVGDLPCRPCDQRVCAPGDFRCLRRLDASTVAAAVERALGRQAARLRTDGVR